MSYAADLMDACRRFAMATGRPNAWPLWPRNWLCSSPTCHRRRASLTSPCAVVCLVNQPDGPQAVVHADRGRLASPPVVLSSGTSWCANHRTYGGGQLSLVSEVFVVTTWQVLSIQYSVTLSWKIVQRLKFHPDWIPGVPVDVSL